MLPTLAHVDLSPDEDKGLNDYTYKRGIGFNASDNSSKACGESKLISGVGASSLITQQPLHR